ncbi:hypothetical protein [Azotobacter beijerinckii]|uniref:Tetratricopeptide repeat-containing protein n=1 Tax=Azotobacter beijerinckii TaxID=170623 RepID=A0A1I4CDU4_9GAMM|nr:hypothetical protein [Azotobacter beijerinckii]SFB22929.1 hypothetical protein SAMN04244571_01865 [Azotobacter beijerinckii]SFK79095.1 hypothetical protein SAMN04244574_01871 [Azotobacter beijerinckii]
MPASLLRYLPPLLLPLLLAACQRGSTEPAPTPPPPTPSISQELERQLSDGDLAAATASFKRLQLEQPGTALEDYQRRLSEAWLKRGEQALARGDMSAAATALSNARALMPKAPALSVPRQSGAPASP